MTTVTEKDMDVLARTIWGEARSEGMVGMIAVGWTIRNRVEDGKGSSWWGEGYTGVCQKPYQFSCWLKNDPNSTYLRGEKPIPPAQYKAARTAAEAVVQNIATDPTQGATHYYADTIKAPDWVAHAKQTVHIGHHLFFRDVK